MVLLQGPNNYPESFLRVPAGPAVLSLCDVVEEAELHHQELPTSPRLKCTSTHQPAAASSALMLKPWLSKRVTVSTQLMLTSTDWEDCLKLLQSVFCSQLEGGDEICLVWCSSWWLLGSWPDLQRDPRDPPQRRVIISDSALTGTFKLGDRFETWKRLKRSVAGAPIGSATCSGFTSCCLNRLPSLTARKVQGTLICSSSAPHFTGKWRILLHHVCLAALTSGYSSD